LKDQTTGFSWKTNWETEKQISMVVRLNEGKNGGLEEVVVEARNDCDKMGMAWEGT
jgi:hypothetical protein